MPLLKSLQAGWDRERPQGLSPEELNIPAATVGLLGNYFIRQPYESLKGLAGEWQSASEGRGFDPQKVQEGVLEFGMLGAPVGYMATRGIKGPVLGSFATREALEDAYKLVDDYGIPHRPTFEDAAPLHEMTKIYPDDIYGPKAAQYYGHAEPRMDAETVRVFMEARGKPGKKIRMYRAVPQNVGDNINPGDWVTTSKTYAEQHGRGLGDYKILEKDVPASELYTSGDSFHEWGWFPKSP